MSLLSRRLMLAVATIVDIALHARPTPVAAKALADRFALPPRHLETLLQALVHSKILKGVRGPKGGYELARERRRISMADIIRAVSSEEAQAHPQTLVDTLIAPAITDFESDFMAGLEQISIADLCLRAEALQRAGGAQAHADFTI